MSETLVKVENVSKKFCRSLRKSLRYGLQDIGKELRGAPANHDIKLRPEEFWAVQNISLELNRGECLGLVGRNGAGKTTLLKLLNGLIKPDMGRIEMRGRVGALIALGAGFNPILSGRENIYVNASVLGIPTVEIDEHLDEIVEFAEVGPFIDAPVQSYSSGMRVRLGFAIATTLKPDVLLLDEVLAVGDTAFRAKCFDRIGRLLSGIGVIFVSHDENQLRRICDRVVVLANGTVRYSGPTNEGLSVYRQENKFSVASQFVASPSICDATLTTLTSKVAWGEDLELMLGFDSIREIPVGLVLVHLFSDGMFVSHADFTAHFQAIRPGRNEWRLRIKTLHLVAAQCYASVSIFSADRKVTILHMINAASFEMTGRRGFGPLILHEGSVGSLPR